MEKTTGNDTLKGASAAAFESVHEQEVQASSQLKTKAENVIELCSNFVATCHDAPKLDNIVTSQLVNLVSSIFNYFNYNRKPWKKGEQERFEEQVYLALECFVEGTHNFDSPEFSSRMTVDFLKFTIGYLARGRGILTSEHFKIIPMLREIDPALRALFFATLSIDTDVKEMKSSLGYLILAEIPSLSRTAPIARQLNYIWAAVPLLLVLDFTTTMGELCSLDERSIMALPMTRELCSQGIYEARFIVELHQKLNPLVRKMMGHSLAFGCFLGPDVKKINYLMFGSLYAILNCCFDDIPARDTAPADIQLRLSKCEEFAELEAQIHQRLLLRIFEGEDVLPENGPNMIEALDLLDRFFLYDSPKSLGREAFIRILSNHHFPCTNQHAYVAALIEAARCMEGNVELQEMLIDSFYRINKPIPAFLAICYLRPPKTDHEAIMLIQSTFCQATFPDQNGGEPYRANIAGLARTHNVLIKLVEADWKNPDFSATLKRNYFPALFETLLLAAKNPADSISFTNFIVFIEERVKGPLFKQGLRERYANHMKSIVISPLHGPTDAYRMNVTLFERCLHNLTFDKATLSVVCLHMLMVATTAIDQGNELAVQQKAKEELPFYMRAVELAREEEFVPKEGITLATFLAKVKARVQERESHEDELRKALEREVEQTSLAMHQCNMFERQLAEINPKVQELELATRAKSTESEKLRQQLERADIEIMRLIDKITQHEKTAKEQKARAKREKQYHAEQMRHHEDKFAEEQKKLLTQITTLQQEIEELSRSPAAKGSLPEDCQEDLMTQIEMLPPKNPVILNPDFCGRHDLRGLNGLHDREEVTKFLVDHKGLPIAEVHKALIPLPFLDRTIRSLEGTTPKKVYFHTKVASLPILASLDRMLNLTMPLIERVRKLPLLHVEIIRFEDTVARLSLEQQIDLRALLRQPIPATLLGSSAIDRIIAELRAISESGIKLCLLAAVRDKHHPLMDMPAKGNILKDSHRIPTLLRKATDEFGLTAEFRKDIERIERAGLVFYKRDFPVRDEGAQEVLAYMHNITKRLAENPSADGVTAIATAFKEEVMPVMQHLLDTVIKLLSRI